MRLRGGPVPALIIGLLGLTTVTVDPAGAAVRERPRTATPQPDPVPEGPLTIVVSIRDQKLALYAATEQIASASVSTGTRGHETPTGIFSVIQKERMHYSNLYNAAPMPFMQRITWSGVALHAGYLPGYAASHGCVRMPPEFARKLYEQTKVGARVVVTSGDVSPAAFSHPRLAALTIAARPGQPETQLAAPMHLGAGQAEEAVKGDGGKSDKPAELVVKGSLLKAAEIALAERTVALEAARAAKTAAAQKLDDALGILQQAREAQNVGRTEVAKARAKLAKAEAELKTRESRAQRSSDGSSAEGAEQPIDPAVKVARDDAAAARKEVEDKDETLREISDEFEAAERARAEASIASEDVVLRLKIADESVKEARRDLQKRQQPITLFVSRKTGKLYVRQGFEPILEAPVTLDSPEAAVGTHVFTVVGAGTGESPLRWTAMTVPGYGQAERSETRKPASSRDRGQQTAEAASMPVSASAALDRLHLPAGVIEQIGELMKPGSSLIISDQGLSPETGKYTDLIVQTR